MVRLQSDLFLEFPVHGLLCRLIVIDAALGELPGILTHTSSPEQAILVVTYNYAYIRPETIPIYHGNSLYFCYID